MKKNICLFISLFIGSNALFAQDTSSLWIGSMDSIFENLDETFLETDYSSISGSLAEDPESTSRFMPCSIFIFCISHIDYSTKPIKKGVSNDTPF